MTQASQSVEDFVRRELGCGCPDEVFRAIGLSAQRTADGVSFQRLSLGQRLLIYVLQPAGDAGLAGAVGALAEAGRAERDRQGYNRFRLVIATETPQAAYAAAGEAFAAVAAGDERAHLHVLPPAVLPAALSSPARRSAAAG